jgi:hypothetical protein
LPEITHVAFWPDGGFVESIIANQPPPVSAEKGRETVRVMNMIVEELGVAAGRQKSLD